MGLGCSWYCLLFCISFDQFAEPFINILLVKMQRILVFIETRCGAKITGVTCLCPTFWKQLVSVLRPHDPSLRFYLLSICFPSVSLPDTPRSWCPWSVAREEDRVITLLPFPWCCSSPLTWVLSLSLLHIRQQIISWLFWVLLHGFIAASERSVKPILSCWSTVARHGVRGE